jgi:hypothetical protein
MAALAATGDRSPEPAKILVPMPSDLDKLDWEKTPFKNEVNRGLYDAVGTARAACVADYPYKGQRSPGGVLELEFRVALNGQSLTVQDVYLREPEPPALTRWVSCLKTKAYEKLAKGGQLMNTGQFSGTAVTRIQY